MYAFLSDYFVEPTISYSNNEAVSIDSWRGIFGIYAIIANDPTQKGFNATGHITLFQSINCGNYECYNEDMRGGYKGLKIWQLK